MHGDRRAQHHGGDIVSCMRPRLPSPLASVPSASRGGPNRALDTDGLFRGGP